MNTLIILALCACAATAAPAGAYNGNDKDAVVVRSDIDNIGTDGFSYTYETSNGIAASEQGQLTNAGTENEAISVRGQYAYTGPDGVQYTVTYVADENGFQPQGAHLPVAQ